LANRSSLRPVIAPEPGLIRILGAAAIDLFCCARTLDQRVEKGNISRRPFTKAAIPKPQNGTANSSKMKAAATVAPRPGLDGAGIRMNDYVAEPATKEAIQ
jgi:hypothetical protein